MILRATSTCAFLLSFIVILLTDGGVYPLSLAIAVVLMALALIGAGIGRGLHAATAPVFVSALLLWLVLAAWMVLQSSNVAGLGLANGSWTTLHDAGISAGPSIAAVPGDAIYALLPISLPFMTFLASLLLFRSDNETELALQVFALSGAGMALFAIAQTVFLPDMLMFGPKESYIGSLTAPFVNRNTAATFYGVILVVLIVYYAASGARATMSSARESRLALSDRWIYADLGSGRCRRVGAHPVSRRGARLRRRMRRPHHRACGRCTQKGHAFLWSRPSALA
jgi:hypothetical protein